MGGIGRFCGDFEPVVLERVRAASLRRRGLFEPKGVKRRVPLDRNERVNATYTIFSMICVEPWCRSFIDEPTPSVD